MKRLYFAIIISTIMLIFVSCAVTEKKFQSEGNKPLSQEELQAMFKMDRTANWKSPNGSGSLAFHPDGTSEVSWGSGNDKGKYWIENGKFCSQWTKIRGGKPSCFTAYKLGENKIRWFFLDGRWNSDTTFN